MRRVVARYPLGVSPQTTKNRLLKLAVLLKPVSKQISVTDLSLVARSWQAACTLRWFT